MNQPTLINKSGHSYTPTSDLQRRALLRLGYTEQEPEVPPSLIMTPLGWLFDPNADTPDCVAVPEPPKSRWRAWIICAVLVIGAVSWLGFWMMGGR